jgi:MoxR-like ATPase
MNGHLLRLRDTLEQVRQEISRVIIGQSQVVDLALVAVLTGHHVLIEGVPGVGKTSSLRISCLRILPGPTS